MPYNTIGDLPEAVRGRLPEPAQEIYRAAFNIAWETYAHDEELAGSVAWEAVKQKYQKDKETGNWVAKPSSGG